MFTAWLYNYWLLICSSRFDHKDGMGTATAAAAPVLHTPEAPPATTKPGKGAIPDARNGKIVPAVPLAKAVAGSTKKSTPLQATTVNTTSGSVPKTSQAATQAALNQQTATTQAATAAVAAAMAKLGTATGNNQKTTASEGIDNLTKKVNEMRTDEKMRNLRQSGAGGYSSGYRGRGGARRGAREQGKGIEVPKSDFDFESANAKFNKQDIAKGPANAITDATAPVSNGATQKEDSAKEAGADATTAPLYNSTSSFFDNISSDLKDREPGPDAARKPSGQEFRNEERKRNLETFGLGSVEGGFRGGYRGRGRGRGGYRGRGGGSGRGNYRGRGGAATATV